MTFLARTAFWALLSTIVLYSGLAFAEIPVDERATATGGFGHWLLSVLFEAGSVGDQPEKAGLIGSVIRPFSLVCLAVICLVIIFKSIQHVLVVAQAKDVESSPISMTWAPIHLVVAVMLAAPLPSGYSTGQYAAIWVAEQSNLLGNLSAELSVGEGEYTVITEAPLPAIRSTVQGIVDSQVCMVVMNALGEYVASQGGARLSVSPRSLSDSEIQQIAGAPLDTFDDGAGYSRMGVVYEATRQGAGGNFANQPLGLNSVCGTTIVEYDSFYEDYGVVDFNNLKRPNEDTMTLPTGRGGPCPGGILCSGVGGEDSTRKEDRRRIAAAFQDAHQNMAQDFINLRNSPDVDAAVDELTYDIEAYFDALTSPELQAEYRQMQSAEPVRIEQASKRVVDAIDKLQTQIYRSYGDALDKLRSSSSQTGDSHKDAVLRTGWPVLGLYWFQQQSYNSQVMETVNFAAQSRMSVGQLIRLVQVTTGDQKLAERIADRLTAYRRAVNRAVLNTRLDTNPLSMSATGSISDSAQSQPASDTVQATSMAETMSTYIEAMVDAGSQNQGALTSDGTGMGPSHLFRAYIFPYLIYGLRDDNLVTGLVNTGHNLIVISEVAYGIQLLARTSAKWAEQDNDDEGLLEQGVDLVMSPGATVMKKVTGYLTESFVGIMVIEFLKDLTPMIMYLFFLGLFLAFYLPAVVMVQWIIGLVQWMIYVIEATVVIPLWAIMFASDMGQKSFTPQTAQQGLIHLVSILFYPTLMVIGFTIGNKVLDVSGVFLIDYIMIGFLGMTANYSFGIVSAVVGMTLVGIVAYQVIMRIFSGMLELNDRAIGWIGNRATFGENNSEQAARSAMLAVLGRGENLSSRATANNQKGGGRAQNTMGGNNTPR